MTGRYLSAPRCRACATPRASAQGSLTEDGFCARCIASGAAARCAWEAALSRGDRVRARWCVGDTHYSAMARVLRVRARSLDVHLDEDVLGVYMRGSTVRIPRTGARGWALDTAGVEPLADAPRTMADQVLERLNELALILSEPPCPWAPDADALDFHGSAAVAWLAGPPCAPVDAVKLLDLTATGAMRFAEAWGYVQGVADSCDLTVTELLDSMGIQPIPGSALMRRAG